MSDDVLNHLLTRMDRLEALANSHTSMPDRGDEIVALRKEVATLKSDLLNRDIEVRDLRSIVASKMSRADVLEVFNRNLTSVVEVIGDSTGEEFVKTERTLRTEIADATRSLQRDVERAESAAASSIKSAAAIIGAWAAELGA